MTKFDRWFDAEIGRDWEQLSPMELARLAWNAALSQPHAAAPVQPAPTEPADWRIDTSAGGPILVYKNCSVIEAEQAQYVLNLITAAQEWAKQKKWLGDRICNLVLENERLKATPAPVAAPAPADTRVCHRDDRCLTCPRYHGNATHCSVEKATEGEGSRFFREALLSIKYKAVSLADAQVMALRALNCMHPTEDRGAPSSQAAKGGGS